MSEVVLLAGGLGTRLRSVVSDVPKPLAPVAGRPFLEHLMDRWITQGASRFVLSVGYMADKLQQHFGGEYRGRPLAYAVETEPLGTGGGLRLALAAASGPGPVFAANGDTFFAIDAAALARFHAEHKADFTMALYRSIDSRRYTPVGLDAQGAIRALKAAPAQGEVWVNGGVYLVGRNVLEAAGFAPGTRLSLEEDLLPALLSRGARLFGFPVAAPFIDIGVPDDYARAASVIAAAR